MENKKAVYLGGLPSSLRFGDMGQATLAPAASAGEVNALREGVQPLQGATQGEM